MYAQGDFLDFGHVAKLDMGLAWQLYHDKGITRIILPQANEAQARERLDGFTNSTSTNKTKKTKMKANGADYKEVEVVVEVVGVRSMWDAVEKAFLLEATTPPSSSSPPLAQPLQVLLRRPRTRRRPKAEQRKPRRADDDVTLCGLF